MYAYDFEGRRYDVVEEYALRREKLRDVFIDYLKTVINNISEK